MLASSVSDSRLQTGTGHRSLWAGSIGVWVLPPAIILSLAIVTAWRTGGVTAARMWLQGQAVQLEPTVLVVPVEILAPDQTGPKNEVDYPAPFVTLRNLQGKPLQVLGAKESCAYATATSLPATIEPFGTLHIPLRLSETARGTQTLTFFTDAPATPRLTCRVEFRGE